MYFFDHKIEIKMLLIGPTTLVISLIGFRFFANITSDGLSFRQYGPTKSIRWIDVKSITISHRGNRLFHVEQMVIAGIGNSITIDSVLFDDYAEIKQRILSSVPANTQFR